MDETVCTVEVRSENIEPPSWEQSLRSFALHVLHRLACKEGELSLLLVDDILMQKLNKTYRGKDEVTDVLSFSGDDPTGEVLGDIVISVPYVEEQAEYFGVSFDEELRRITIHGILHLLGMTHSTRNFQTEPMLQQQEQLLQEIRENIL
jgi:probable rRNA maturation factor